MKGHSFTDCLGSTDGSKLMCMHKQAFIYFQECEASVHQITEGSIIIIRHRVIIQ